MCTIGHSVCLGRTILPVVVFHLLLSTLTSQTKQYKNNTKKEHQYNILMKKINKMFSNRYNGVSVNRLYDFLVFWQISICIQLCSHYNSSLYVNNQIDQIKQNELN